MKKVFEVTIQTEEGNNIDFSFVAEHNEETNTVTMPEGFEQMVAKKLEVNHGTF